MSTEAGAPPAAATLRPPGQRKYRPVRNLTNTQGSSFRNVFMISPGMELGPRKLTEFTGIEQKTIRGGYLRDPRVPADTAMIIRYRSLNARPAEESLAARSRIEYRRQTRQRERCTRAVLARDPDGYLLELIESPKPEAAIGVTVSNPEATRRFYEDLLGFRIHTPARFETKALKLLGLTHGEYRVSSALVAWDFDPSGIPPSSETNPWSAARAGSVPYSGPRRAAIPVPCTRPG